MARACPSEARTRKRFFREAAKVGGLSPNADIDFIGRHAAGLIAGPMHSTAFTLAALANRKMPSTTSATEYHLCLVGRVGAAQSP